MNRKVISRAFTLSALFAAMLPAMQAGAAAFQVAEHSAAGIGRANAGEAAIAEDASVLARNAAGMSFLDGPMFTGAASFVRPNIEVENTTPGVSGLKQKNVADNGIVPVFYYVAPLNDKISYGVGGFTNYGFATNYDVKSGLTLAGKTSDVKSYKLNGSLAYKLQDNLSVGFGLNAVHVKAHLTNKANFSGHPQLSVLGVKTALDMKGDDWALGWNAGVMWEPVEGTRIGLSYTSEVKSTLKGKGKSDATAVPVPPPAPSGTTATLIPDFNSKGSAKLDLPAITELSIWQKVNDQLAVHASYQKTAWSSFDILEVKLDNGASVKEEHKYNDVSRWAVGATYKYNDAWIFRTGYAYDNSPVSNAHRSFRIPDGDREWFSVGAGYKIDNNQKLDIGYAFLKGEKGQIHYSKYNPSTQQTSVVDGKVTKSTAHIVSLQYNYRF